jgi:preprotein translocase subunit SecA
MNCDDGTIIPPDDMRKLFNSLPKKDFGDELRALENELRITEMKLDPTKEQMNRTPPRVGRNEPCPCGSGKKFKKCHLTNKELL